MSEHKPFKFGDSIKELEDELASRLKGKKK